MGKVAGAQNFDGANWYEQHIAKRTRDALAEQDRAFAEKHAGDSLDQLAAYLRRCAGHWGKSPAPIEIVGGSYIAERFGDWKDALRAAHLNPIYKNPRNRDCGRYQKEKSIQIQLHRVERDAKRAARAERAKQRKCECEVKDTMAADAFVTTINTGLTTAAFVSSRYSPALTWQTDLIGLTTPTKGNVNLDPFGYVDKDDLTLLNRWVRSHKTRSDLTEEQWAQADINGDGVLDSNDTGALQNYITNPKLNPIN